MILTSILLPMLFLMEVNFNEADAALKIKSCEIECEPPTLGLDLETLRRPVENGLGINEQFFDVEHFTQTIPTQNFTVGDSVNVRLTVFENSGYQYLRYVELSIVVDEPLIQGGTMIEEYKSSIAWRQNFAGIKSIDVDDTYDLFKIINVTDSIDNNRTVLNYEFIVTKPIKSKTMTVQMWDSHGNVWNNYFHDAITVRENNNPITPFENELIIITDIDRTKLPKWIQNIFSWYDDELIKEEQMIQMLRFLIEQQIIQI